jgi:hypothetical protein
MIIFCKQNTFLPSLEFLQKTIPCDMMLLVSWSVIQIRELVQSKSYTVGATFLQQKDTEPESEAKGFV